VLAQTVGPITSPDEMGGNFNAITSRLQYAKPDAKTFINVSGTITPPVGVTTYADWFCQTFQNCSPLDPPPQVTKLQIEQALATYELAQIQANSDVDNMRAGLLYTDSQTVGGSTMSLAGGYAVFTGQGRCSGCHSGGNFSDELRHQSGPLDAATGTPTLVKTPTLRALSRTYPYFHDGSNGEAALPSWCPYTDAGDAANAAGAALCRVVEFYNDGACRMDDNITVRSYTGASAPPAAQSFAVTDVSCDPESVSLGLSVQQRRDLVGFLIRL